jgi:hypothetical protein
LGGVVVRFEWSVPDLDPFDESLDVLGGAEVLA